MDKTVMVTAAYLTAVAALVLYLKWSERREQKRWRKNLVKKPTP